MRPFLYILLTLGLCSACVNENSPERVRKVSEHSLEIAEKYLHEQQNTYEIAIRKRIRDLDADIKKIKEVSGNTSGNVNTDAQKTLLGLLSEKDQLEFQLRELRDRTQRADDMIRSRWKQYDQGLDTMLQSMDNFLKRFGGIKDSVEKRRKP